MPSKLTEAELIERVERLVSGCRNDEEMKKLFREISENVRCPYAEIQGYIFHAKDNPSAETIVARILSHRPITL